MIYLNLADLASIRRRQEIHAAELKAAGLIKDEDEQDKEEGDHEDCTDSSL